MERPCLWLVVKVGVALAALYMFLAGAALFVPVEAQRCVSRPGSPSGPVNATAAPDRRQP